MLCTFVSFQVIEGLDCLINLEKLFLGKNKITKIQVRIIIYKMRNMITHLSLSIYLECISLYTV